MKSGYYGRFSRILQQILTQKALRLVYPNSETVAYSSLQNSTLVVYQRPDCCIDCRLTYRIGYLSGSVS